MMTTTATSRRKNLRLLAITAGAFAIAGSLLVRAQVPPLAYDNYAGYTNLRRYSLKGWDGDPTFWRVEALHRRREHGGEEGHREHVHDPARRAAVSR